jgi:hypothetical protein
LVAAVNPQFLNPVRFQAVVGLALLNMKHLFAMLNAEGITSTSYWVMPPSSLLAVVFELELPASITPG